MRKREARIVIAFSRPHVYEPSRGSFDPYFSAQSTTRSTTLFFKAHIGRRQDVGDGNEKRGLVGA
jgi:hypothetical protein